MKKISDNSSSMNFDSSAIEKIRLGDIYTFEKLFRQHYHPLLQFANRFVCDLQIAKDIVQDIFLNVWSNREKLKPDHNIRPYLYIAVRNKSLKYLRHVKIEKQYKISHIELSIAIDSPEDAVNHKEFQTAIEKSIQALPLKCRTIFCMNRFDNLRYSEIATIQGISIKTVETQMGRALKLLRSQLKHFLLSILF